MPPKSTAVADRFLTHDKAGRTIRNGSNGRLLRYSRIVSAFIKIVPDGCLHYLDGTNDPILHTSAGAKTTYVYDYRGRRVETTVTPRDGQSLTTTLVYTDNKLFSSEDPYGRMTYFAYDATDGRLIRTDYEVRASAR